MNKANVDTTINFQRLELLNGFTGDTGPRYAKLENGNVNIFGTFYRDIAPISGEEFAILPVGFRPIKSNIPFNMSTSRGNDDTGWSTYGWLQTDGVLRFSASRPPNNYVGAIAFNIWFLAL